MPWLDLILPFSFPWNLFSNSKVNPLNSTSKVAFLVFYGFDQKINYGNFDRAIRKYENWQVTNSHFSFDNKPGWGYHAGAELTIYVTQQLGISLETNYLMGDSMFPLKGSYTGGNASLETKQVEYTDAKIDLTGLEFSIGVIIDSGGGGPAPKKKKRRR